MLIRTQTAGYPESTLDRLLTNGVHIMAAASRRIGVIRLPSLCRSSSHQPSECLVLSIKSPLQELSSSLRHLDCVVRLQAIEECLQAVV